MKFLTPAEKLLMLAIANYCDHSGRCFPSAERLQRDCGWSSSTYSKYIKILKHAGLIKKTPRASTLDGRETDLIQVICSSLCTGEEFENLEVARKLYTKKSFNFSPEANKVKNQSLKESSFHTGKDKPLTLSQRKNTGSEDFDLQAELESINAELEDQVFDRSIIVGCENENY